MSEIPSAASHSNENNGDESKERPPPAMNPRQKLQLKQLQSSIKFLRKRTKKVRDSASKNEDEAQRKKKLAQEMMSRLLGFITFLHHRIGLKPVYINTDAAQDKQIRKRYDKMSNTYTKFVKGFILVDEAMRGPATPESAKTVAFHASLRKIWANERVKKIINPLSQVPATPKLEQKTILNTKFPLFITMWSKNLKEEVTSLAHNDEKVVHRLANKEGFVGQFFKDWSVRQAWSGFSPVEKQSILRTMFELTIMCFEYLTPKKLYQSLATLEKGVKQLQEDIRKGTDVNFAFQSFDEFTKMAPDDFEKVWQSAWTNLQHLKPGDISNLHEEMKGKRKEIHLAVDKFIDDGIPKFLKNFSKKKKK